MEVVRTLWLVLRRTGWRVEPPFMLLWRLLPMPVPLVLLLELRVVLRTRARAPARPAAGALAVLTSTAHTITQC